VPPQDFSRLRRSNTLARLLPLDSAAIVPAFFHALGALTARPFFRRIPSAFAGGNRGENVPHRVLVFRPCRNVEGVELLHFLHFYTAKDHCASAEPLLRVSLSSALDPPRRFLIYLIFNFECWVAPRRAEAKGREMHPRLSASRAGHAEVFVDWALRYSMGGIFIASLKKRVK